MTKSPPWSVDILTLHPAFYPGPLGESLSGKALENNLWALNVINIRDFAKDKYGSVDDTPAGGGPGMVVRADILADTIDTSFQPDDPRPLLVMSPRGTPLSQNHIRNWTNQLGLRIICPRFEGVDERILQTRNIIEISIGDYILSGGDIAAMVLLDSCIRLLPNAMGNAASATSESFENSLLEYPHYTRPQEFEGMKIPEVLRSGHHENIDKWRLEQSKTITRQRRPDLWQTYTEKNSNKNT